MAALPSFTVNKETIALVAGLIGLATVGWNVASYIKGLEPKNNPVVQEIVSKNQQQDMRLDRTDEDRQITKDLSQKTSELTSAVVKLTTVIEQGSQLQKKAYWEMRPAIETDRQAINLEVR
ncbi:hypothetical protein EVB78_062 [Rhizobium phage RHph_N1_15]|nr:hypothetical protein EVB77_061 [Rhizobium phage RHph_N1_10]QIG69264.1 hypothetical protein EVB78_062 [Rhizobium phage RHph_N1_15]QIG75124.1 hypothetical protein EVC15_062 [Rhizobium phage RHph_N2_6]